VVAQAAAGSVTEEMRVAAERKKTAVIAEEETSLDRAEEEINPDPAGVEIDPDPAGVEIDPETIRIEREAVVEAEEVTTSDPLALRVSMLHLHPWTTPYRRKRTWIFITAKLVVSAA